MNGLILNDVKGAQMKHRVMICCPFHKDGQEKKPSFEIKGGVCRCHTCGWTGTIQEMKDGCLALKRRKGEDLAQYSRSHPYWAERGITDECIIELFDLGYDDITQCITFPVRDIDGNCLFVARRSVHTKYFNYPSGVEKPLYGLYELSELSKLHHGHWENEVVVCESMLDALTCWQYGKYAVAMNGLGTDLQMQWLRDLPCRVLILATDMDDAGFRARERIKKMVTNKTIYEYKWDKNIAKDINEMSEDCFRRVTCLK